MPRAGRSDETTIHDIIRLYRAKASGSAPDPLNRLDEAVREYEKPQRFTLPALHKEENAELLGTIILEVIRGWNSREKGKAAQALRSFALYLQKEYCLPMDVDLLPRDIPDVTQRRLDMLKFLQTPQTMEALEDRYLTSTRTLRNDLSVLVNGWDIMGTRISIDRIDIGNTITYNSTVHPVLLPLNLTEVYALAVGMPRLAQKTMFEEISEYVADAVTGQLSDHALGILSKAAPGMPPKGRAQDAPHYRPEQKMLAQSRNAWLMYLVKQGMKCRITYANESGEVHRVEGIPSLPHGDMRSIGFGDGKTLIPADSIVAVEPLEPYR